MESKVFFYFHNRYLSQGVTPRFLAWSYKMGRTTVRNIVLETCEVLWNKLSETYVSTPNEAGYSQIAEDFFQQWNMLNCLGALDGKHINIQCPPNSHTMFFNYTRKHLAWCYLLHVMPITYSQTFALEHMSARVMEVNIFI